MHSPSGSSNVGCGAREGARHAFGSAWDRSRPAHLERARRARQGRSGRSRARPRPRRSRHRGARGGHRHVRDGDRHEHHREPELSILALDATHEYRITASGTISDWCPPSAKSKDDCSYGSPFAIGQGVDALYCYATWRCPTPEPWRQLRINGKGLDELAGLAEIPKYDAGHTYEVVVSGISGRLSLVTSDGVAERQQRLLLRHDQRPRRSRRTPTAAELIAKLKGCRPTSSARFANDAGGKRSVPICGGLPGVVSWKADMDVDCDGRVTPNCNKKKDPSFQPSTALEPGGKPLDAETTRYVVVPRPSKQFDYRKLGIKLGSVVAVVYNGKVTFAVLGDVGPRGIIGEASYATAKALGIDPNPRSGGVDSGVTYIVFKGTKVADPTSNASIDEAGLAAAEKLLGGK